MLDLNEVAMFVQVARLGSFAEAARHLHVPSTTLSRRIQQLETRLGTRLMQRSTRKLTLTSAGQAFHERCGLAIEELIEAGDSHIASSQEPSGSVRVAAPANFFDFFSMDWVAEFLAAHPRVKLDFVLSDVVVDLIEERIDVAFRGGALQDSSYVAREVFESYGSLVASPAYLATYGMPNSLRELGGHRCLTPPPDTGSLSTWRLEGPGGTRDDVRVQGCLVSNMQDVLRKAACAGLGVAALPAILTVSDLDSGRLVPVLPQYKRVKCGLSVIYASRRHIPKALSTFVDMAIEKLRQQQWAPAPVDPVA